MHGQWNPPRDGTKSKPTRNQSSHKVAHARLKKKKKLLLFVRISSLESEPSQPDICLRRRVALLTSRSAKHDADRSKQSKIRCHTY
jgi:hypothetical protein